MSILDPKRLFDGYFSLADGVDCGRNPSLIAETQCASAENMVFRGGVPRTRPGFRDTYRVQTNPDMLYDENGIFVNGTSGAGQSATILSNGVFQGACYYAPGAGKPSCFIVMISGRLYQIVPRSDTGSAGISSNLEVTEIALDKTNSPLLARAYFCQADRFCIIQDGQSKAIVFDGVVAKRSDDIPVGTIMAYGMGRLVVVVNDFRALEFGDFYGSHDDEDAGLSVLKFTETTFLNEGGSVSLNFSMGKIKALVFPSQQDSSTGDGELLVGAEGGVTHFHVSLPRDQWKDSAFAQVTLQGVAFRGDRAVVSINGDVWFRSDDGIRSYRQARSEMSGWAHLPMSTEVRTWIDADTLWLLDYASAIKFDNRLIITCTPQPNNGRLFHNGLLSLDFDVLSSFGQATRPAWDGHWSKMRVTQLISGSFHGEERAWAFALDKEDHNQIREITRNDARDYSTTESGVPDSIAFELVTRSMDFKSAFNEKENFGADIWVHEVRDAVILNFQYRPDQHPVWTDWLTLPAIEPVGTPQAITPGGVPTLKKGFVPRRTISKPDNDVDSADFTGRNMRLGFEFQARISGTGCCALRKFRMHAKELIEDDKAKP